MRNKTDMSRLNVGDKVKIMPTRTQHNFKGKLTGKVLLIDTDGTIAIEVDNGNGRGHSFPFSAKGLTDTNNGWWFLPEELKVIGVMPRLTKRQSIRECKKLWREIEKSGLSKYDFLYSKAGKKWQEKVYAYHCPLCEYVGDSGCDKCPLVTQYGEDCASLGYSGVYPPPGIKWMDAVKGIKE